MLKKGVFVEAADPNAVDEVDRFPEMTTANGSSQCVLKSVAPAMRHNAANEYQKRGAEFQLLRLCYQ